MTAVLQRRCAVYTRVSTEHGLDQDFNSLDAQREACAAYIKSQTHEGWRLVPSQFADGGYSGGSMDRPALSELLAAIRRGEIDVVVVYKVDRLTRSLADFARLVELFDKSGVSFVSVTQSFNTTSSMGRLTLNVLLSFAQFEREVTGERIRDKIAASKRKGLWVGGPVPLGYRVEAKKLVVDVEEAGRVRHIFERYLVCGTLDCLLTDLKASGVVTKRRLGKDGQVRGGIAFTKGSLAYLLRNRAYVGDLVHKGRHFDGQHAPLLDRSLFDAVQAQLDACANARGTSPINVGSPLDGLLFDSHGRRMRATSARKGNIRYRYYVSVLPTGNGGERSKPVRVPAPEIETAVISVLRSEQVSFDTSHNASDDNPGAFKCLGRVVVHDDALELRFVDGRPSHHLPWTATRRVRRGLIGTTALSDEQPIRSEARARLLSAIARARKWVDDLTYSRARDTHAIATREGISERSVRMTLNLAFLSPALVEAVIAGKLPRGAGMGRLQAVPLSWGDQWGHLLGR